MEDTNICNSWWSRTHGNFLSFLWFTCQTCWIICYIMWQLNKLHTSSARPHRIVYSIEVVRELHSWLSIVSLSKCLKNLEQLCTVRVANTSSIVIRNWIETLWSRKRKQWVSVSTNKRNLFSQQYEQHISLSSHRPLSTWRTFFCLFQGKCWWKRYLEEQHFS